MSNTINSLKVYYGWVILLCCFTVAMISYGLQYSFGVFFKPLIEEFGWTRTMLSGVFSVYTITYGISGIFLGGLSDKYGPRMIVLIGGLIMGLSLIMTSRVENLWQFYICYGIFSGIGRGVGYVPLQSTISRWFIAKRGLAIGVVASGSGFGTLILSPLSAYLITRYSWRAAYSILGIVACLALIGSAVLIRRSPEDIHILPYRYANEGQEGNTLDNKSSPLGEGFTLREVAFIPTFWLLIAAFVSLCISLQIIMVHFIPYSTDIGISKAISATFLGLIGGFSIPGRLLFGSAADRTNIGAKKAFLICLIAQTFCMFWLALAKNIYMICLFIVVFGFSYGGYVSLIIILTIECFGIKSLGMILGVVIFIATTGGIVGPVIAGFIYDTTSSYKIAFIGAGLIVTAGFFAGLLIRDPDKRESIEKQTL